MSKDLSFKTVTQEQISELQENFNLNFSYFDRSKSHYSHAYNEGKTTFSFVVRDEILPEGLGEYFAAIDGEQKGYFFNAVIDDDEKIEIINDEARGRAEHNLNSLYKIYEHDQWLTSEEGQNYKSSNQHQPKSFQSQPALSVDLISEKIKQGKKLHFFTGAGLSIDAIPDWNGLMKAMGFDQSRDSEDNLKCSIDIIQDHEKLSVLMMQLHQKHQNFFKGEPSKGHEIIGEISKDIGCAILTDNRDILHQVSGFDAIHVCQIDNFQNPAWDPYATCNPSKIDGLVVCGMSGDQRGFIKWLQEQNPEIEIINMNFSNTLAEMVKVDHFIEGDLQENLKKLKDLLEERTKVGEPLAPSSVTENPQATSVVKDSEEQSVTP